MAMLGYSSLLTSLDYSELNNSMKDDGKHIVKLGDLQGFRMSHGCGYAQKRW